MLAQLGRMSRQIKRKDSGLFGGSESEEETETARLELPSQKLMNSTIELIQMEPFWNLDIRTKIGFSIFIVLILGFGIIVQRQLISFLKCNRKRYVNQIISNNLILQNIFYPPQLFYYFLDVWGFNPCQRVGFLGVYLVYGLIYTGLFIVNYDRAHSLFINFFRYICIVKEESLRENLILPQVSLVNYVKVEFLKSLLLTI